MPLSFLRLDRPMRRADVWMEKSKQKRLEKTPPPTFPNLCKAWREDFL